MWIEVGRVWTYVGKIDHMERFLKMVSEPPKVASEESRMINMGLWNMGNVPGLDRSYADNVKDNAAGWMRAWKRVFGDNIVIRTSDRLDGTVKHTWDTCRLVFTGV